MQVTMNKDNEVINASPETGPTFAAHIVVPRHLVSPRSPLIPPRSDVHVSSAPCQPPKAEECAVGNSSECVESLCGDIPTLLADGVADIAIEHWPKYAGTKGAKSSTSTPIAPTNGDNPQHVISENAGIHEYDTSGEKLKLPTQMDISLFRRLQSSVSVIITATTQNGCDVSDSSPATEVVAHANFVPPPPPKHPSHRSRSAASAPAAAGISEYPLVSTTVYFVVVRKQMRGHGLGKRLMATLEAAIAEMSGDTLMSVGNGVVGGNMEERSEGAERGHVGAAYGKPSGENYKDAGPQGRMKQVIPIVGVYCWPEEATFDQKHVPFHWYPPCRVATAADSPSLHSSPAQKPGKRPPLPRLACPIDAVKLETPDQQRFYESCGYRVGRTAQLTTDRPVFGKFLAQSQLDNLNKMFGGGSGSRGGNGNAATAKVRPAKEGAATVVAVPSSATIPKKPPLSAPPPPPPPPPAPAHAASHHATGRESGVWLMKMLREEGREGFSLPKVFLQTQLKEGKMGGTVRGGAEEEEDSDKIAAVATKASEQRLVLRSAMELGIRLPSDGPSSTSLISLSNLRPHSGSARSIDVSLYTGTEENDNDDEKDGTQQQHKAARTVLSGCVTAIPWQRQIGPTCGLSLLRMLREWAIERCAAVAEADEQTSQKDGGRIFSFNGAEADLRGMFPTSLVGVYLATATAAAQRQPTEQRNGSSLDQSSSSPCLGEVLDTDLLLNICNEYFADFASRAGVKITAESVNLTDTLSSPFLENPPPSANNNSDAVWGRSVEEKEATQTDGTFTPSLVKRSFLLVPYDRCATEQPSTTTRGARAHWGVIVGFLRPRESSSSSTDPSQSACSSSQVEVVDDSVATHVVIQHGAHRDLVVAPLTALVLSSAQLFAITFVDPTSGEPRPASLAGLRGRAVRVTFEAPAMI